MLILKTHVPVVDQLAFGPDGRLYTAGIWYGDKRHTRANRGIEVWDVPGNATPIARLLPNHIVNAFVLNPTHSWLYASADHERHNPDDDSSGYFAVPLPDGHPVWLGLHAWGLFSCAVHESGEWVVASGCKKNWENRFVMRWHLTPKGPPRRDWEKRLDSDADACWHMIADRHEPRVITTHVRYHNEGGSDCEFVMRNPTDWQVLERVPTVRVEQLVADPDGSRLVCRNSSSLLVWKARDLAAKPRKVRGGKQHYTGIAFHPSGRYLAATSNDQTVTLYDTATWELAKTFTWDIGQMRSIAFSPDGTLAAAGSDSGKVVVWDVDV